MRWRMSLSTGTLLTSDGRALRSNKPMKLTGAFGARSLWAMR
jgi:hypothetical protein